MEPLAILIDKLKKERKFMQEWAQTIVDTMMVSKGITLMAQTEIFNKDIRECQRQATDQKTW